MNEELNVLLNQLEESSFECLSNGSMELYGELLVDIFLCKKIIAEPNSLCSIEETTFLLNKYKIKEVV